MSIGFTIKVIIEVIVCLLICYGVYHEDKVIEFEDEMWAIIKWTVKHPQILRQNVHKGIIKLIHRKGNSNE